MQNEIYKYLKLEKNFNLESLGAFFSTHIGTYRCPFEILGWSLKPSGVGRAHPAPPLATPMIVVVTIIKRCAFSIFQIGIKNEQLQA